jgi:hypothetical protein
VPFPRLRPDIEVQPGARPSQWSVGPAGAPSTLQLQEPGYFLLRLFDGSRDASAAGREYASRYPTLDRPDVDGFLDVLREHGLLVDDEWSLLLDELAACGLRWRGAGPDRREVVRPGRDRRDNSDAARRFEGAFLLLDGGRWNAAATALERFASSMTDDLRLAELAAVIRGAARRREGAPAHRDPSWEAFDGALRRFLEAGSCPSCGERLDLSPGEGRCPSCFASFSTWILRQAERRGQ